MQAAQSETTATVAVGTIKSKGQIVQLLRGLVDELQANYVADQRKDRRYPLCVAVEVAPCDLFGCRSGESFTAVTKDISAGGMALLHRFPIRNQIVQISFPGAGCCSEAHILLQVIRRRPVGPFWEIAGPFLTEFG